MGHAIINHAITLGFSACFLLVAVTSILAAPLSTNAPPLPAQGRAKSVSSSPLADRLHRHVVQLAEKIGERNVSRPKALQAAADYIRGEWLQQGYEVTSQRYVARGVTSENIEVSRPGSVQPDEIIVVGAHYDTAPGTPGADDNASGVAALLEISRVLEKPDLGRTVRLVAFVNEEPPFFFWGPMGSGVYAEAARRRGDDIVAMLSLEMLGVYSDRPYSQRYPPFLGFFYPDRGNFIAFVSNLSSRPVLKRVVKAFRSVSSFPSEYLVAPSLVPGVGWSDQLSFWRVGYPALMVTDTAFYRYAHYHKPEDTPDKLDYDRMAQVVDGLAKTIAALADDEDL
ncbi:MAG: M28 family peptidase [Pseudomonadota bacterium]